MTGFQVEGNRINFDGVYMQPLSGMMTSTPFPIITPGNAPPKVSDTGLTSNLVVSRKRSGDMVTPLVSVDRDGQFPFRSYNYRGSFNLSQIYQQQQLEMDQLIYQHIDKVKLDIAEKRNRDIRGIVLAIEQAIMKKLRVRDQEIDKIVKLNSVLQEKVKSLSIENQLWRELAQTNEQTTNALRNNLEQVLAQVSNTRQNYHHHSGEGALEDEAVALVDDNVVSCCGSNDDENEQNRVATSGGDRLCRMCGTEEASVLVLPCRHLSLCTVCGSSVYTCPICKCTKTASVHINLQ